MNELDLETERSEAAWQIYLALLTSGKNKTYQELAESAFMAVDIFNKVKLEIT